LHQTNNESHQSHAPLLQNQKRLTQRIVHELAGLLRKTHACPGPRHPGAVELEGFSQPFLFSYLSWQNKACTTNGVAVLRGSNNQGSAGLNGEWDLGGWPMLEEFTVDHWAPNLQVWGYLAARK